MYTPSHSINIKDLPSNPIRLGIIGKPGTGKTWAALTFPNPVIADFDNKLKGWRDSHSSIDVPVIPFWNRDFVVETLKVSNRKDAQSGKYLKNEDEYKHNVRDAFKKWLHTEGPNFTKEQTLIVDSISSLNDFFDLQTDLPWEKSYNQYGKEDPRHFWSFKLKYNTEIFTTLKDLNCNVICIFHEQPEYDDNRKVIDIKPLIQGQSADKAPKDFTDFFRQRVFKKEDSKIPKGIDWFTDKGEAYCWITVKTEDFQMACKSNEKLEPIIKADYKSLLI